MLAMCSGETTKHARSSAVRLRGGRRHLRLRPGARSRAPGRAASWAPEIADWVAGNVGLRGEGASKV
eukprot:6179799-Pleurochrysis_carterae.AAC.1